MQPTRLPLSGGRGIEGPVGFRLYNVKAYAVSQRTREIVHAEQSTETLSLVRLCGIRRFEP
jgi:hypothetical protein